MSEYVIIGDTKAFKDCLVYTCGTKKETAKKALAEILANPTANEMLARHTNFRIKKVDSKSCWWNDKVLAN